MYIINVSKIQFCFLSEQFEDIAYTWDLMFSFSIGLITLFVIKKFDIVNQQFFHKTRNYEYVKYYQVASVDIIKCFNLGHNYTPVFAQLSVVYREISSLLVLTVHIENSQLSKTTKGKGCALYKIYYHYLVKWIHSIVLFSNSLL